MRVSSFQRHDSILWELSSTVDSLPSSLSSSTSTGCGQNSRTPFSVCTAGLSWLIAPSRPNSGQNQFGSGKYPCAMPSPGISFLVKTSSGNAFWRWQTNSFGTRSPWCASHSSRPVLNGWKR